MRPRQRGRFASLGQFVTAIQCSTNPHALHDVVDRKISSLYAAAQRVHDAQRVYQLMHNPHSPSDVLTPRKPSDEDGGSTVAPFSPSASSTCSTPAPQRSRPRFRCAECERGNRIEGIDFTPGDRVMCRRIEVGRRGGRASIKRFAGVVKSVTATDRSTRDKSRGGRRRSRRVRGVSCHVLFDDGVCQTLETKYVKKQ